MTAVASRQYELTYILSPDATEQQLADLHDHVVSIVDRFGGSVEKTEQWGRRKLAYEIDRHREGTYVLELLNGSGEMVRELDRRLRVMDEVIRHLFVRVDEELRVAEASLTRRRDATVRRRASRGLPPEPEGPAAAAPAGGGEPAAPPPAQAAEESGAPAVTAGADAGQAPQGEEEDR